MREGLLFISFQFARYFSRSKEYSVWVDETAKIVSFHEVNNSELIYFDQREIYLAYLSALTTQGYRFQ